jgi:hypothetical protein
MNKRGKEKSRKVFKGEVEQGSVTISFRLCLEDSIDRKIFSFLEKIDKGERSKVIKTALFNHINRVGE